MSDFPLWTLTALIVGAACFAGLVVRARAQEREVLVFRDLPPGEMIILEPGERFIPIPAQQQELVRDHDASPAVEPRDELQRLRDAGAI